MNRSGFSLIEVMTALVLSGVAATLAAAVFASTSDAVRSMQLRSQEAERRAEGVLWLREALLAADVTVEGQRRFFGSADSLRFRTTLPVPQGWRETVEVLVTTESGRMTMQAGAGRQVLFDSLATASFDYLAALGSESPWLRRWDSFTSAPPAVRLRIEPVGAQTDTLLFYIGRVN